LSAKECRLAMGSVVC